MAKYINPFTDVGFKRIFGQELSKPLLLDFLNSLFEGEKHIVNLTFLDKEQPALFEEDRSLIYDIYWRTRQTLWGECTDANLKTVAKRYMIEKK